MWGRLELDPARPVTITPSSLSFGTITQTLSDGGSSRSGANLPVISTDANGLIQEIWQRLGLDETNPLVQTVGVISTGSIVLNETLVGTTSVVTRQ